MLALFTYNAHIYPLPSKIRRKCNTTIERFMSGYRDNTINIDTLSQPLLSGGYNTPNIPLYCDLCYIRPLSDHAKHRINLSPANAQTATVEFNIGHQLSKLWALPFKNFVPHTARPSLFYAHALALVKKYKLTLEQLSKLSLHQLYQLLNHHLRTHPADRQTWRSKHNPVLTNTLRTFNYRSIHEILPLSAKKYAPYLDPRSTCSFCKTFPEKSPHLFFTCSKITPVWKFIKLIIWHLDDTIAINLNYHTIVHFTIPLQLKTIANHIIYLFTVTRYKIWTHRNDIEHNKINFSTDIIIQAISRSIKHRLSMEKRTTTKTYVQLFETLQSVTTKILK